MLTYLYDDLFASPALTLVNPVNTVGVMGKGMAREFQRIYPEMFRAYHAACQRGDVAIGRPWLYRTPRKWILNFPTKADWRHRSQLAYIEQGLESFAHTYAAQEISSVAFPAVGCGQGGLAWSAVRPVLERYLAGLALEVFVYPPSPRPSSPTPRDSTAIREWLRSAPASLPAWAVWDDLVALAHQGWHGRLAPDGTDEHGEPGLALHWTVGVPAHLAASQWPPLWDAFRRRGFLSRRVLTEWLGDAADPVWTLLTHLPYVTVVPTAPLGKPFTPTLALRIPARSVSLPPARLRSVR